MWTWYIQKKMSQKPNNSEKRSVMKVSNVKKYWAAIALIVFIVIVGVLALVIGSNNDRKRNTTPNTVEQATAVVTQEDVQPQPTEEVVEPVEEPAEEPPVVTDEPDIIDLNATGADENPIITVGKLEYETPDEENSLYSMIKISDTDVQMYGYMDKAGTVHLRGYGTRYVKHNNVNKRKLAGYFNVGIEKRADGRLYVVTEDPADPVMDNPDDAAVPVRISQSDITLPELYVQKEENLYVAKLKTGALMYRTFASVGDTVYLFDCTETGEIKAGSIPVNYNEEKRNLTTNVAEQETAEKASQAHYSYPGLYNNTKIVLLIEN